MDLDTITVDDFKNQFVRDFAYLPVWDNAKTYNTGAEVYYDVNELFYRCLNDGVTSTPVTVADWEQYSDSIENYVQDADITRAFGEAKLSINQALFSSDAEITLVYLYITAHYLVQDLQTALEGIESTGRYPVNSRSVGSVSESYSIPQRFLDDPMLSYYATTGYGRKYLSFLVPRMIGAVDIAHGATTP